jgi:hypothetical protein
MSWIATVLGWTFSICLFLFIFVSLFLWAARWDRADSDHHSVEHDAP